MLRCTCEKGNVVIVPPGWVHATINANVNEPMLFGAWCVRDYGFDYAGVRRHKGIAYFPKVNEDLKIDFVQNEMYQCEGIEIKKARTYEEFGLEANVPIYTQYEKNPDLFLFVTHPEAAVDLWKNYRP